MSAIATAIVGTAVVGGYYAKKSAKKASQAQVQASEAGISAQREQFGIGTAESKRQFGISTALREKQFDISAAESTRQFDISAAESTRQFEAVKRLLQPYVQGGVGAISGQQDLLGLGGPEAQASAIQALENSPQYQMLVRQGEEAMLQNASATGGLRGGNLQGALAQYRPQVLSQLIEAQFGRLGQVAGLGQASAAGVGAAGQQYAAGQGAAGQQYVTGQRAAGQQYAAGQGAAGQQYAAGQGLAGQQYASNIGTLLGQQGQAIAGGHLAQGQAWGQAMSALGNLGTLKLLGGF